MAIANVNGLNLGYDIIGTGSRPWVLTPGGRYTRDTPGLAQLAEEIAKHDARVLIWDRPNCGESDISFDADNESNLNADAQAALLDQLDMNGAVNAAGSAGARVALLAALRHPESTSALALWWPSGGSYELFILGQFYCSNSIKAAWKEGTMEAVAALEDWRVQIERNPANRDKILAQSPQKFIETMERWQKAFSPRDDQLIPGLPNTELATISVPALVFNSGYSDANHPRWVSEELASRLPNAQLVDPPWGDREWWDRQDDRANGIFRRWPLLAPQLTGWADEVLGASVTA